MANILNLWEYTSYLGHCNLTVALWVRLEELGRPMSSHQRGLIASYESSGL